MSEEQDLLQYLVGAFVDNLAELNPGIEDVGKKEAEKAEMFLRFAKKHLEENRIQGVYPADDNYGLILTNGVRVLVLPGGSASAYDAINNIDTSGTMKV
jgi:hypothetical protein